MAASKDLGEFLIQRVAIFLAAGKRSSCVVFKLIRPIFSAAYLKIKIDGL